MSNTESAQTQWKDIAKTLGFSDEPTMWYHLYVLEERPIKDLSKTLGFGTATIARRIGLSGVEKRKRGGGNNPSRIAISLARLDQRFVRMSKPDELAHIVCSSIHSIYRLMKEL